MRLFAFGGSDAAPALEGVHRLYQFALRDQREGAILILVAAVGVVIAAAEATRRPLRDRLRGLDPRAPGRDARRGAYENHLLDLLVLTAAVVAGMWTGCAAGRGRPFFRRSSSSRSSSATVLAVALHDRARHAGRPRARADGAGRRSLSRSTSLRGRRRRRLRAVRGRLHPAPRRQAPHRARRVHGSSPADEAPGRARPPRRPREATARSIGSCSTRPLTDLGWFAVLDFGSQLAQTRCGRTTRLARSQRGQEPVDLRPTPPGACRDPLPARSVSQW